MKFSSFASSGLGVSLPSGASTMNSRLAGNGSSAKNAALALPRGWSRARTATISVARSGGLCQVSMWVQHVFHRRTLVKALIALRGVIK